MARLAYPAKVVSLFTSSSISAELLTKLKDSPCFYDPKDQRALAILTKYGLVDKVTQSVRELLGESNPRTAADAQLDEWKRYRFVQEYVIACNNDAMEGMAQGAFKLGLSPFKLNSTFDEATVEEFAQEYVRIASLMILAVENQITKSEMYEQMMESPVCPLTFRKVEEIFPTKDKWGLGLCLLLSGRPIVHLCERPGKGGPNQELALYFSLYWHKRTNQYPILRRYTVWFLGGSSYGKDGNTNAAGAFGYKSLATDVYSEYEKARSAHKAALLKWRRLAEDRKQDESEIAVRTRQ